MQRHAFSLVELSIVLVILGLLTGGILGGQSLIRAAELRSISTDTSRIITAAQTFRDKYFAMPGDMNNATSFWGKSAADCNAHTGTAATPGTCNGNGNGVVDVGGAANGPTESLRFWQQLALAGLIEGSYTGNAGPAAGIDAIIGTNTPRMRIGTAGWWMGYVDNSANTFTNLFVNNYTNWILSGTDNDSYLDDGYLNAEEAWNVDTKMDDGQPARGSVFSRNYAGCTTSTVSTDLSTTYALNVRTANACPLYFRAFN
ncbi:MAG: hypothetical protein DI582_00225 [Azospirillum brasilense]|nr:MAG: hypothetical protein DI582_00225 [Azospirillum brasilense]